MSPRVRRSHCFWNVPQRETGQQSLELIHILISEEASYYAPELQAGQNKHKCRGRSGTTCSELGVSFRCVQVLVAEEPQSVRFHTLCPRSHLHATCNLHQRACTGACRASELRQITMKIQWNRLNSVSGSPANLAYRYAPASMETSGVGAAFCLVLCPSGPSRN